jgi:hypothetical protein
MCSTTVDAGIVPDIDAEREVGLRFHGPAPPAGAPDATSSFDPVDLVAPA